MTFIQRPRPPKEISFSEQIHHGWQELREDATRGHDVSIPVRRLERTLADARKAFTRGELIAGYDWDIDLLHAEELHELNNNWLNTIKSNHAASIGYWTQLATRQEALAEKLLLDGIKILVAGHGAVAIACLNALASERGERFQAGLVVAIFGSLIGIGLATCGKILAIESLSKFSSRIKSKLAYPQKPAAIKAIGKFAETSLSKSVAWIPYFLYGSILTFLLYAWTAMLLIIHAPILKG